MRLAVPSTPGLVISAPLRKVRRMSPDAAPRRTPLNVVLIGFMGCGKTTLGARLAQMLGLSFVDMDDLIVKKAGCSIPEIFARDGEAGFRRIETAVLDELLTRQQLIVSTGGGVVTVPDNIPKLRALGYVIWLDLPERAIWQRVSRNRSRPLLRTPNPRQTVHDLLETRRPLYEAACDLVADTGDLTPDEAAYGIAETVRMHFTEMARAAHQPAA